MKIGSGSDLVSYLNDRPVKIDRGRKEKTLIQYVAFFSHGLPGIAGGSLRLIGSCHRAAGIRGRHQTDMSVAATGPGFQLGSTAVVT